MVNLSYPPSLSHGGKLRSCTKSDLLVNLSACTQSSVEKPQVDVLIIDGDTFIVIQISVYRFCCNI